MTAPRRLCLNCDNRHGCASPEPLCLTVVKAPDERGLRGKALMQRRGLVDRCRRCEHFSGCWGEEEYRRVRETAAPSRRSGRIDG